MWCRTINQKIAIISRKESIVNMFYTSRTTLRSGVQTIYRVIPPPQIAFFVSPKMWGQKEIWAIFRLERTQHSDASDSSDKKASQSELIALAVSIFVLVGQTKMAQAKAFYRFFCWAIRGHDLASLNAIAQGALGGNRSAVAQAQYAGQVAPGQASAIAGFLYSAYPSLNAEIITAGATSISPYAVLTTDTRILFNKTLGSPSYAALPSAASMLYPGGVVFKDLKGDAFTNNITITFSNGELCDGLSSVIIENDYGWVTINPVPGVGGAWYLTS
jgi:hypothetical protein